MKVSRGSIKEDLGDLSIMAVLGSGNFINQRLQHSQTLG